MKYRAKIDKEIPDTEIESERYRAKIGLKIPGTGPKLLVKRYQQNYNYTDVM
jgi:hypothetical protein